MTRNEGNTEGGACNEERRDKKEPRGGEKFRCTSKHPDGKSLAECDAVCSQRDGLVRVALCLNPADRSPCLPGDENQ